ncbi:hypothetical protein [Streptomyces bluensis]|uniref:Uncharacterized protein n=1 Tax=Streptomyces bluensis TaxID=33897 RepID=A0ABW6UIA8_9ACTN
MKREGRKPNGDEMTHLVAEPSRTSFHVIRTRFSAEPARLGGLHTRLSAPHGGFHAEPVRLGALQGCFHFPAAAHVFAAQERQQQCDDSDDDSHGAERKCGF